MMYYFFAASLPGVKFGEEPPFDVADFDEVAAGELSGDAWRRLVDFSLPAAPGDAPGSLPRVYREFYRFEALLRTRIARRRADRSGVPLELPEPEMLLPEAESAVTAAAAATSPAEREEILDRARWSMLDELECNHFFDFEFLCVYRLRLLLAARRRRRTSAERGRANFDAALDAVSAAAERSAQV